MIFDQIPKMIHREKVDGLQVAHSIHIRSLYAADDTWLQNNSAHATNIYQKTWVLHLTYICGAPVYLMSFVQ